MEVTLLHVCCCDELGELRLRCFFQRGGDSGEFGEDVVRGWDGFGGMDRSPADCLVDAVEDGGEGVGHLHVFRWVTGHKSTAATVYKPNIHIPFIVLSKGREVQVINIVIHC